MDDQLLVKGPSVLGRKKQSPLEQKNIFNINILEDDAYYNKLLQKYVASLCNERNYPDVIFNIRSFKSAKRFIDHIERKTDILILDHFLDEWDEFPYNSFDIVKAVKSVCEDCKIVVISGQRSVTVTKELFKNGIYEYIDKDYKPVRKLYAVIEKILLEKGLLRR